MATMITEECINCGACEPECPNVAIYAGGVQYEFNGQMFDALSNDFYHIVPEKCTECVGHFDQEQCAAVCPVDCCVPDPNRVESEARTTTLPHSGTVTSSCTRSGADRIVSRRLMD